MMSRRQSPLVALLAIALITSTTATTAHADPCGMVPPPPPLEIAATRTIERIGVQKTYVAHANGIETMVLRPGFQGKVEEFGMLIPFPSPPSIRKVDDNIFSHLAAAIDPPEVIARVQRWQPRPRRFASGMAKSARSAPAAEAEPALRFDEVKVVRQEAVGMYEVAVLAAGGSKALQKWMNDNGFRYPDGMDTVVEDYVQSKWYFVAVKTNVGQKAGVNPHPGMREAVSKRPSGSTFNGFVQAMGFRFETKELVVPMRLSVFNADGNARNIVFALTDKPSKISGIPEGFVKRQISGKELYQNVTNPLPLRVIGGTKNDLNASQLANLPTLRDPTRHNGLARELFAADMLAIRKGVLVNKLEEKEKALLNIGETLGLRGRIIDDLNRAELKKQRDKLGKQALSRLRGMTLTVIDGDFDRNVLAKQNLKFQRFRMASSENNRLRYDAVRQGPGFNQGGKLYRWELAYRDEASIAPAVMFAGIGGGPGEDGPLWPISGLLLIGGVLVFGRRRWQIAALAAVLAVGGVETANAQHVEIAVGSPDSLIAKARNSSDPVEQGNAIIALANKGGSEADVALADIASNSKFSMLVRTWAVAGRIAMATELEKLQSLESFTRSFPATREPWTKRMALLARNGGPDELFTLISNVPELRAELQGEMESLPAKTLLNAMLTSNSQQVRQQSASYLGTKGKGTDKLVAAALRFDKSSAKTPWGGGALYLPNVSWSKENAKALATDLLRWMLWAEAKGDQAAMRVAANNLRSSVLSSAAGYEVSSSSGALYTTEYWLGVWTKTYGSKATDRVLRDVR